MVALDLLYSLISLKFWVVVYVSVNLVILL